MKQFVLVAMLIAMVLSTSAIAQTTQPIYKDASAPVEQRVSDLLGRLTSDEKIDLINGIDGMHVRENARLGLPRLNMSDGPCGMHNYGPTTAYPGPITLAATFDVDLARRFGQSMGRDAR